MKRGEGCWFDGLVGDWLVVCCHEGLLCWESGVSVLVSSLVAEAEDWLLQLVCGGGWRMRKMNNS